MINDIVDAVQNGAKKLVKEGADKRTRESN
jgi:hypothetical protein